MLQRKSSQMVFACWGPGGPGRLLNQKGIQVLATLSQEFRFKTDSYGIAHNHTLFASTQKNPSISHLQ